MRSLDIEPYILSQSEGLYIINKPPSWPTTGRTLDDDDCIQFHLIKHHGGMVWSLHQLDADTTGLCFFTTRKDWVQPIKELWSHPETHKEYLAIIHGAPNWTEFEVDAPIGKNDVGQLGVHPKGKPARSRLEVIDSQNGFSLLRVHLFTGRTHQIRIHLQHLGYSLVGEEWYRAEPCTLHPRQALHAYRIQLPDDSRFEANSFTAPLPEDLRQLASQLKLSIKKLPPRSQE
ncbi:MAG: RluA family pseudouridine synthase [Opitutaceae bacterium]